MSPTRDGGCFYFGIGWADSLTEDQMSRISSTPTRFYYRDETNTAVANCIAEMFGMFNHLLDTNFIMEIEGRRALNTSEGIFLIDVHLSSKGVFIDIKKAESD